MRAHRKAHIGGHTGAHIWEHTYESTNMHTYEVPKAGTTLCASVPSWKLHGHVKRTIFYGNLQEKCRAPIPGHPFCASLRSQNAHGHFTKDFRRAILYANWQERCRTPRHPHRSNTGPLSLTIRTPSVWPHRLRDKKLHGVYRLTVEAKSVA